MGSFARHMAEVVRHRARHRMGAGARSEIGRTEGRRGRMAFMTFFMSATVYLRSPSRYGISLNV